MKRRFEFILYAAVILFFLVRYTNVDSDIPRRPIPDRIPADAAILLPENARLPSDISPTVIVDVARTSQNSVGTAFAVDANGTYVSARHVVEGCSTVSLINAGRRVAARLVAKATNRDFAILKVDSLTPEPFALSVDVPRRGDDGFMMGYPQGSAADVHATVIGSTVMRSKGRYNARERVVAWVERERRPQFGGSLGGISGGPVLDGQGRIVGTVVAGAPRRGRVYTTNPAVFSEVGLVTAATPAPTSSTQLTKGNFDKAATRFRRQMRIAQVYCEVS